MSSELYMLDPMKMLMMRCTLELHAKGVFMATTGSAGRKKAGTKAKSGTDELAGELAALIPELDAEGLAFLVEQARVHLYNMRAAELERAAVEADRASTRARTVAGAKPGATRRAETSNDFAIKATSDGSTYDLVYQGKWKMFTGDEMLAMVRIVSSKDPVSQLTGRLYRWFLAERSDVINDLGLAGLADPRLRKLVALLRKTFTIKGAK